MMSENSESGLPEYAPEPLPENNTPAPDRSIADLNPDPDDETRFAVYQGEDLETRIDQALQRQTQTRFVDDLLALLREANRPKPLVILEREQADFLRHLLLDLVAGNETARYAVDRLRIGLDLLDGRTRE